MSDCIFDKIIQKEIPAHIVYEDDVIIAFLDISQVTKGHTLIVPKQHVQNIYEYDENLATAVFSRVPKIARALKNSDPHIQGLNILVNNEEAAGQTVFHSHIHLIPRYHAQDRFDVKWETHYNEATPEELVQLAQSIAHHVKGEMI